MLAIQPRWASIKSTQPPAVGNTGEVMADKTEELRMGRDVVKWHGYCEHLGGHYKVERQSVFQ